MNREKTFAMLRIGFGFVWAIDAWFKWQPAFQDGFVDQVSAMLSGQPGWINDWIQMWVNLVSINPHFFALVVALAESAIAIALIFGLFTRAALIGGIVLSLVIWTVPEGFGGPYVAGATDIGAGIIYAFALAALWLGESWKRYSVDSYIWHK
ncbi:MAG TPA: DoxX family membrane protein [Candidatus Paceibacterota bacterium]|nr:DoxX family membrane protein [Candidatus Paceibacterota bacterium]